MTVKNCQKQKGQNLEFNQYGYLCLLKNFWAKVLIFFTEINHLDLPREFVKI